MYDFLEEIHSIAVSNCLDCSPLNGSSVLVTGATGLIGSTCVRFLLERNRTLGSNTTVFALVRNEEKAQRMLGAYDEDDGLHVLIGDIANYKWDISAIDYVIHAGCPTASDYFKSNPVETSKAIVNGTVGLLDFVKSIEGFSSMVYVSSMEVYGSGNDSAGLPFLKETDLGLVDPMLSRSCYPEGKRMAENYCRAYADEYDVPVKVIRLAQTFGPGIAPNDGRVFTQFARSALSGEDIVLRTTGTSTRMYLYTFDAVTAIFTVLLKGKNGEAYNAANPETLSSVKEMGELVARTVAHGKVSVRVEVDPDAPYPPEHHLPLDVSKLEGLGWKPTADLKTMYNRLVLYIG